MRAVLVGLVGAVLLGGAAQAGECHRTYTLTSTETEAFPPRPELVGAVVKEVRRTSTPKSVAIEVAGKPGRFVVQYHTTPHSVPGTTGSSAPASREAKIAWNGKADLSTYRAGIYSGPLSGLYLEQNPCE